MPNGPASAGKQAKSFFHHAATASVWLILPTVVINFLASPVFLAMERTPAAVLIRVVSALTILVCMVSGVVLGIVALCGIPKYGWRGILIKALIGLLVPILMVLAVLPATISAAERTSKIRAQQQLNPEN